MPHPNSRYEAFGEKTGGTGAVSNKYLFAGEQYDSNLGDYYLRARYYDTDNGRFTRRDSYEGRLNEPLTLHKYVYANANTVNLVDPTGLISQDPQQLSTFGTLAETAIQGQYETDKDFLGDSIYFGTNTSIGCGVGTNKALCPDILNYDQKHYMEVKPFTPNGRKAASESMGKYKTSLQPEYMPNTTWKAIPNIGNIIVADGTPIIYFNDEGVLFYTTRTHLSEAIVALSAITSLAKRRSALKKMRESGQPGLPSPEPSPAFQSSSLAATSSFLQQANIALIAAIAAAALLARYGWA